MKEEASVHASEGGKWGDCHLTQTSPPHAAQGIHRGATMWAGSKAASVALSFLSPPTARSARTLRVCGWWANWGGTTVLSARPPPTCEILTTVFQSAGRATRSCFMLLTPWLCIPQLTNKRACRRPVWPLLLLLAFLGVSLSSRCGRPIWGASG